MVSALFVRRLTRVKFPASGPSSMSADDTESGSGGPPRTSSKGAVVGHFASPNSLPTVG